MTLDEGRLRLNLAAFSNTYSDMQTGVQGLTSGGQPVVISVSGNSISATFSADLLPSTGFDFANAASA